MFHVNNILDISRNLRSESTSKRIGIKDPKSAAILKRHVDGAELISPTMKEIIKEEKDQGFKRQGYYNKPFRRRNSFNSYSNNNFDLSGALQLAQILQKLSNNKFFLKGGNDHDEFSLSPKQLVAYVPRKLAWKRRKMWLP
jgi:hypothetical protein